MIGFVIHIGFVATSSYVLWLFARNRRGSTNRWWFFGPFFTLLGAAYIPLILLAIGTGNDIGSRLILIPFAAPLLAWHVSIPVLVGFAIALMVSPSQDARTRACPYCAEKILRAAKVCPFCQRELPVLESSSWNWRRDL